MHRNAINESFNNLGYQHDITSNKTVNNLSDFVGYKNNKFLQATCNIFFKSSIHLHNNNLRALILYEIHLINIKKLQMLLNYKKITTAYLSVTKIFEDCSVETKLF